jgi:hypothetical protein
MQVAQRVIVLCVTRIGIGFGGIRLEIYMGQANHDQKEF